MDKITNDARVYTDLQNLEQLRGALKTNPEAVKHEVAQQFESLFLQMVLRSMRDANKAFSSDLLSSNDMSMYQDMFDNQLSLALSTRGLGFSKMIETNLSQHAGIEETNASTANSSSDKSVPFAAFTPHVIATPEHQPTQKSEAKADEREATKATPEATSTTPFASPKQFVENMWEHAKQAALIIGVHPSVLIAQAALETDWGRKVIPNQQKSSHNLFNIKSDASWNKETAPAVTLEQKSGILSKEKALFRSYESYKESFLDYARLIKDNTRYKKAVDNAPNPAAYTQALQEAGYATDQHYAHKIMGIVNSPLLRSIIAELK